MPKLTLSAEKEVIDQAKRLAERRGTSVSAMFSQFVKGLAASDSPQTDPVKRPAIGPITRRAAGLVKLPAGKTDRELIEQALTERYGK